MQGKPTKKRNEQSDERPPSDGHASHPSHGIGHLISMAFSFAHHPQRLHTHR
jgi:hypothetical protein